MSRTGSRRERSKQQAIMRRERGERAYLFDQSLVRCLAEIEREEWEFAIRQCQGNVARAVEQCGHQQVPSGAKVLWGVTAQAALEAYRRWQKRRK